MSEETTTLVLPVIAIFTMADDVFELLKTPIQWPTAQGDTAFSYSFIPAIKYVRALTDASLIDAKDYVENILNERYGELSPHQQAAFKGSFYGRNV